MKVLVMGHKGMLAQALIRCLQQNGVTAVSQGRPGLDITQPALPRRVLKTVQPDIVINAAAYTAVDRAEEEKDQAFAVNRDGIGHAADACREMGVPLLHVSTDYVFDGKARLPYREDDTPAPLGVYGESKRQGEVVLGVRHRQHLIVRTAWLYSYDGHNFVQTILRLARQREVLRVVDDQYGCPTSSQDLAAALVAMCHHISQDRVAEPWGIYHFCSADQTTWYRFAQAIIEEAGVFERLRVRELIPIATADYPTAVERPAYSVLDCSKVESVFGITPRSWRDSLRACVQELYTCRPTLPETS
jgi:dTDP-4-dehydrorhamnose reductase